MPDTIEEAKTDRFDCPLASCPWYYESKRPEVQQGALASIFGPGVMSTVAAATRAAKIEYELATHFKGHSAVEWVGEIMRRETDTKNRITKALAEAAFHDADLSERMDKLVRLIEEA